MYAPNRRPSGAAPREQGLALILGIIFTIIIAGLVASGTLLLRAHRAKIETNYRLHGQTAQFARSGLMEALGWFRKQTAQPVTDFEPLLDPTATPPIIETIEPEIGIAREFQINGSIWGRYEAWKEWDQDPDPTRLAWRQKVQVNDISSQSSVAGVGNVWRLTCVSYVFRQIDPAKRFDEPPNQVLGTDIMGTEIRRMTMAPPGQAALCSRTASQTTINAKASILGGALGAGIFTASGTGTVVQTNSPSINGSPGIASSSTYDDSCEAVFGVSSTELRALADVRVTDPANFPYPLGTNQIIFVDVPTLTLTPAKPLVGTAVVYVQGDLVFAYNTKSFFTGLLYVDGDLTIREPCEINGTVICNGTVSVDGQSDWVNISYDDDALNRLRAEIGQYRLSAAIRGTLSSE